jgi:uncharacterized protein YceH (UPF0502 family)
MDGSPLNEIELRVLGALIEKDLTTPEYYPLSLNALTNACNQINNREPVMSLGEPAVLRAVELLRDRRLGYVFSGAVNRVVKYGHKAAEVLELSPAEVAVVCVLLLRGPQTLGEIRGRTGRMHEFKDLPEVQAVLQALASRSQPIVACLPRQTGSKEPRYVQLLGGPITTPVASAPAPAPAIGATDEPDRVAKVEIEVAELRQEVAELRTQLAAFRKQFE